MDRLGDDLLRVTLARVPLASRGALRRCCRRFRDVVASDLFWKERRRLGFAETTFLVVGGCDSRPRREVYALAPGAIKWYSRPSSAPLARVFGRDVLGHVVREPKWLRRPALPRGHDSLGLAAHEFTTYAVGGRGDCNGNDFRGMQSAEFRAVYGNTVVPYASDAVYRLDARRFEAGWAPCAPMARHRYLHAVGVVRPPPRETLVAEFPGARWRPGLAAPARRTSLTPQPPLLVVAGGFDGDEMLSSAEALNLDTGRWEALDPLPHATCNAAHAVVGGDFYVAGGSDPDGRRLQVWSSATRTWSLRAPLPQKRSSACAFEWRGMLYVMGGEHELATTNSVVRYDPASDAWTHELYDALDLPSLPRPRKGCRAIAGAGRVVVVGGQGAPLEHCASGVDRWRELPELPHGGVVHPGLCALRM